MDTTTDLTGFFKSALLPAGSSDDIVRRALRVVRAFLGMDVCFITEFLDDHRVLRHVDSDDGEGPIREGLKIPNREGYCQHVVEGRLPELMPDTAAVPFAAAMPITASLPIGAHLSVPIRLSDGRIYGTFCCLSHAPDRSLNQRDLQMLRAVAELTAFQIDHDLQALRERDEVTARVARVIAGDNQFSIAYQPIYRLDGRGLAGFECLARFSAFPHRSPEMWFTEAAGVGLGVELELAAVRRALAALRDLPDDLSLAVNLSPKTILSDALPGVLAGLPGERIVLEVTEHAQIEAYTEVALALQPLRRRGMRVAVDDAGAGYASLRHILGLKPDLIKLDISLVRDIGADQAKRALASALLSFARQTHAQIIAEGVESIAELEVLQELGVELAQGYLLGRPMPLAEAVQVAQAPMALHTLLKQPAV